MRQPLPAVVLVQYVQVGPLWAACDAAEKAGLCSLLQVQESATEDEALDHVSCALLQLIDGGAAAAAALVGQVQLKQDAMATGNAANTLPPRDWLNLLHAARLPVIVQMDLIRKCVCGCEQLGGGGCWCWWAPVPNPDHKMQCIGAHEPPATATVIQHPMHLPCTCPTTAQATCHGSCTT